MNAQPSVVLITGGNSGFGLAGVRAFARNGDTVVATVRNGSRQSELRKQFRSEGVTADIRVLDLTRPEKFDLFIDSVIAQYGRVDVLINNAGILRAGAGEDLPEHIAREVMETNFFAPMLLSRAVLPEMRKQKSGYIIMLSSLSGVAGLAGDVFYSASKFALEGATEALRHEVDRFGIKLALIEAAQYATGIFKAGDSLSDGYPTYSPDDSPYRALVEAKLKEIADGLPEARDPQIVGDLMLEIAQSDGSKLRWQADDLASMVVAKVHRQSDAERDEFLRGASGINWWSDGKSSPDESA